MSSTWDEQYDFIVIGSGAAGMTAALTAVLRGLHVLLLEKSSSYGGTTALSGGVIWVPNNPLMSKQGLSDSADEGLEYLKQVIGEGIETAKVAAYLQHAPAMLAELQEKTAVSFTVADNYPDYYAEIQGGKTSGRSLDPKPYSKSKLGDKLLEHMRQSSVVSKQVFSLTAAEAHQVFSFTWRSQWVLFKRLFLYWGDIFLRLQKKPDRRLTLGKALVARLRYSLAKHDVPLRLNVTVDELIVDDAKVLGVRCTENGKTLNIKAEKGVLLACGGFAQNTQLREQYHQGPSDGSWSATCAADQGDVFSLSKSIQPKLSGMSYAWWCPTLKMPDGKVEAVIVNKSMPHSMMVNKAGLRFCNEAEPYEDLVKHQYQANLEHESIPAFLIFDANYRREYPLGTVIAPGKYLPDSAYKSLFEQGWIRKADTLAELAKLCDIDAEGLQQSADTMAQYAQTGKDEQFNRGETVIDRYYSDHRVKPNPCIGSISKPPFYAVQIWPGDLGTKGGLVTDEHSRVLDVNGKVVEGLYGAGNATASMMQDSYPGAGSTIGPAMAFGYIAACHANEK